jgi:hypothetical protein
MLGAEKPTSEAEGALFRLTNASKTAEKARSSGWQALRKPAELPPSKAMQRRAEPILGPKPEATNPKAGKFWVAESRR